MAQLTYKASSKGLRSSANTDNLYQILGREGQGANTSNFTSPKFKHMIEYKDCWMKIEP